MSSSRKNSIFDQLLNQALTQQGNVIVDRQLEIAYEEIFILQPLLTLYSELSDYNAKNGEVCSSSSLVGTVSSVCSWMGYSGSSSSSSSADSADKNSVVQKDGVTSLFSYVGLPTNQALALSIRKKMHSMLGLTQDQIKLLLQSSSASVIKPSFLEVYSLVVELHAILLAMPQEVIVPFIKQGSQVKKALSKMMVSYQDELKLRGFTDPLLLGDNRVSVFKHH